ncbi:MAG: hypothetical protein QM760_02455 [Nibricoccus sp.]
MRRPFLTILSAALLLMVAGCSKRKSEPPPVAPPAPVAKTEPPKPAPPVAVAQPVSKPVPKPKPKPKPAAAPLPEPEPEPAPDILFSLRGLESGRLANDRPLSVGVRVESSVNSEKILTLAPASGAWSDAIKVELSAAGSSEKILLQARRVGVADEAASATLGNGQAAEGLWLFASSEMAKLSPGDYQVRVTLAIADGTGWHGNSASEPATFSLAAATGAATPEQQTQRTLALAGEAALAQDWVKAAQLLDEQLATDPNNIDLLKSRAALCLQGGNPVAANACVGRAWARVSAEKWTHPPEDLYVLGQAVMAAMSKPPESKAPLPAWSFPPKVVMAPLPKTTPPAAAK